MTKIKRGQKSDLDPLLEDTERYAFLLCILAYMLYSSFEPKEKSRICSPHGIKLIVIVVALAATVQLTGTAQKRSYNFILISCTNQASTASCSSLQVCCKKSASNKKATF